MEHLAKTLALDEFFLIALIVFPLNSVNPELLLLKKGRLFHLTASDLWMHTD